jgi:N-glycosidase YbiA
MTEIKSFQGQYRWLSNFWPAWITYEGTLYPSTEHAYQAAKTTRTDLRFRFEDTGLTAGQAKRLGSTVPLRANWDKVRLDVMLTILRSKFEEPSLRQKLLATYPATLIEGNTRGDRFWGVCDGVGENHLGRLLMQVRDEIRAEK